jgi:hypothetical protein
MPNINTTIKKPSKFLLFPWGLTSIILILVLSYTLSGWVGDNWSWLAMVLIVPAAILENLKIGFTEIKVMFLKIFYSLLSFLVVGFAFGVALAGKYYESNQGLTIKRIHMPWYILVTIFIILLIEVANIYTLLKSVKREFMQVES